MLPFLALGVVVEDVVVEPACGGRGLFAAARLEPAQVIARIPFESCVTPKRAAALVGAEVDGSKGSQAIAVAAGLVAARVAEAPAPWVRYAQTLPWAQPHPLHGPGEGPVYEEMEGGARRAANAVRELVPAAPLDLCFQAVLLVLTHSFDLSHLVDDHRCALVPVADVANHPSQTLVTRAFARVPIAGAVVGTTLLDDETIALRAPQALSVLPGDQLFHWYANAGWGVKDPIERERQHRKFQLQYGFDPWRD